ncbi:MAG: threonine synthase [Deltaproteobacteria bacterium]|nr:MAG: threonine synthase [Deltaproteobacteria bacterium]
MSEALPPLSAQLRCLARCPEGDLPVDTVVYRCPRCGGLLEVVHDVEAISARGPAFWRRHFEENVNARWPLCSGVWGKKAWVLPQLAVEDIVSLGEGMTPLVPSPALAERRGVAELWVKQCGTSHTGSFKDLGMTVLVSAVQAMRRKGRPLRAVACASTGDTSAALAAYAAAAGIPAVVLLPKGKISTAQLLQPLAHGAHVLALDGDFDACMQVVETLTQDPTLYLANSMNSLRIEGQKTVAIELVQQLGWEAPDWVVIPGGNLGNVSALVAGFELLEAARLIDGIPRVCVAQAARANPLYQAQARGWTLEPMVAGETWASAIRIGNPVSFPKAVRALERSQGLVRQASEAQLAEAAAEADRAGLFADPHTGVALAALRQLSEEGLLGPEAKVVVVSTAHALKFTEFKVAYHERRMDGVDPRHPNAPREVAADADAVRALLDTLLERP